MLMDDMPDGFVVIYRGQPIAFTKIDHGYYYPCPAGCCRAYHWIALENVERPHRVTSAPGAPITIVGSLGCPCIPRGSQTKCSWHVVITDGVAKDA